MKFNNKFNRINKSKGEVFDPANCRVDMIGYVPKERRIKMLIEAGQRVKDFMGQYDVNPNTNVNIEDYDIDPTREKHFDLADASEVMKKYEFVTVNFETGEYLDKHGRIGRIKPPGENEKDQRPDTVSRSVSGQLTPDKEVKNDETAK